MYKVSEFPSGFCIEMISFILSNFHLVLLCYIKGVCWAISWDARAYKI